LSEHCPVITRLLVCSVTSRRFSLLAGSVSRGLFLLGRKLLKGHLCLVNSVVRCVIV
jgi:hypothetical protein